MNLLICCSSKDEIPSEYLDIIDQLGKRIKNKYHLIIGGCSSGMMKRIIPYFEDYKVVTLPIYNEVLPNNDKNIIYCTNTIERFNKIYNLADIILIMPGGVGTLAELFSILEEARTIKNTKKIIIFNYQNFYQPIIEMLQKLENLHFKDKNDQYYHIVDDLSELEGVLYE